VRGLGVSEEGCPACRSVYAATPVLGNSPDPGGPGKWFVFGDDPLLMQYDNLTPGNGLPQGELHRRAGSHSGFATTLRVAEAGDNFYQSGSYLLQYEGIYRFNTVPNTPSQSGQVTARGVVYGFIPVDDGRIWGRCDG